MIVYSTGVNYIERQETQSLTLPDSDYSDPYEDVYDGDLHETPVPCPSKGIVILHVFLWYYSYTVC